MRGIRGSFPSEEVRRVSGTSIKEYDEWVASLSDSQLLHEIRLRNGASATKLRKEAKERNLL